MPRVHFVKKARKDNPAVKKGESYYHWQRYRSRKQYSATPPKRSQLTGSSKLAAIYDAEDAVSELYINHEPDAIAGSIETAKDVIEAAAEAFRDVGSEYQESADNMAEYFQGSERVYELEEQANQCEEAADNAGTIVDTLQECIDRLEELGEAPTLADAMADQGDADEDEVEAAHEEKLEEWTTEYDDICNDADNALSEFEGPQF
jgi:hypothetical protein